MALLGDHQSILPRWQNSEHADELVRSGERQVQRVRAGQRVRAQSGGHTVGVHPACDTQVRAVKGAIDSWRFGMSNRAGCRRQQHNRLRLENGRDVPNGDSRYLVEASGT